MHILFLTHYFPPEGNAPASRTYENCVRWVRDGHQVTVITGVPNVPGGKVYDGYRNRLIQRERMDGIDVIRVWTLIAPNKGVVLRIMNYISYMKSAVLAGLFVRKPDLIITTSPQFFCGWAGVFLKILRRIPFILEIRDIWPESIRAVGVRFPGPVFRFLEWLEKRMYAAADHIVTVGAGYERTLKEKGVPEAKISIVMNGADAEKFHPGISGDNLRREFGLENRFVVAYVGTIGMAAGLDIVIRAATRLKSRGNPDRVIFLLVGDGADREKLQKRSHDESLDDIILFTGRQPKDKIPAFIAAADACLVHLVNTPLFRTVLPSKLFEAAAMARPIINGVNGESAAWVRAAGAGICIEPENAEELLGAVQTLSSDPGAAAAMASAGAAWVAGHHSRDDLATRYLAIIQRIAGGM